MGKPGYHNSKALADFLERLGEMDLPTRDEIECRRMKRARQQAEDFRKLIKPEFLEEQVAPE